MPTTPQPTNRTLIIPGKNAVGWSYLRDMQTLEQWARQPIQQLIAGSGITLTPSSGLATDSKGNGPNPITIAASGSGGYASLTGPGQTTTPGKLTQAGDFAINGQLTVVTGSGNNAISTTTGNTTISATSGGIIALLGGTGTNQINMSVGSGGWGVTGTMSGDPSINVSHTQVTTEVSEGSPLKYITEIFDSSASPPSWRINANLAHTIILIDAPGQGRIGFFGAGPSFQQSGAGITTVAQLVTVLQNYGLLS